MTEPLINSRAKKKKTKVVEVAKEIEKSVVIEKPKVEVEPVAKKIEEIVPVAIAPVKRPDPDVRVKAISNARGVIGSYRYQIEKGKIYTFPAYVANFLIKQDRVV